MTNILPTLRPFKIDEVPPACSRWREHMPKVRETEPFELYRRARKLWRSKVEFELTRDELAGILRDVQRAAADGDWGARALLATFYRTGLGPFDYNHVLDPAPEKSLEIIRDAVAAGQPWAYYDLGTAYEQGYGSVPIDTDAAWALYLRAAELGSPDAQMALASAYFKKGHKVEGNAMLMCAYSQEHGPAAFRLAIAAELGKNFEQALVYHQNGTKFGCQPCAAALMLFFDPERWSRKPKEDRDQLLRFGLTEDEARSSRYELISTALRVDPDLRFGRLDRVLPLPPADLPEWRGIESAIDLEADGPPKY